MPDWRLQGLALSCRPLGEQDRLLTLLSDAEGITRLAVPGARRPNSSLAAAVPLAQLQLQVGGKVGGLARVRQLRVLRNYAPLAERLESLAAAQALAELSLAMVPVGNPVEGLLGNLTMQLGRLEQLVQDKGESGELLAIAVQGAVHQLALGGFALPLASCARSGEPLAPPLALNASELALLQRLLRPVLPRRRDGELMGPPAVWLRLLDLVELWCEYHLERPPRAFRLLRSGFLPEAS